jgi:hypothetical protein
LPCVRQENVPRGAGNSFDHPKILRVGPHIWGRLERAPRAPA